MIFGVTGDLSRKKLMPAIYDLANRGLLPPGFALTGFARREWSTEDFGQIVYNAVKEHARTPFRQDVWDRLAEGFRFVQGSFDDDHAFDRLELTVADLDRVRGTGGNHAFYLSIPPGAFPVVCKQLARSGLSAQDGHQWRRVVIEKPFGHDLKSAIELNGIVNDVFPEDSVFRIDHYLGKETVQNILAMRFANQLFEPIWNAHYVDHVQITMAEDIGLGGRAGYYDGIGAARDVIQNHLLQLLAFTAMEEPVSFSSKELRDEKIKILNATQLVGPLAETTAHGQYTGGWQGGELVPGLKEEHGFNPRSRTETFAAITCAVNTRRWAGVPFYLRTGKRLGQAGHGDRGGVQARAAPAVRRHDDRGARPERVRRARAARRGRHAAVRVQGAGQPDGGPRRHDGLRLRHRVHRGLPRGVRTADPRRAARGAVAVPGQRRGRAVMGDPRPGPRALGRGREGPRPVPGGLVGAGVGERDDGQDRTHVEAAMRRRAIRDRAELARRAI